MTLKKNRFLGISALAIIAVSLSACASNNSAAPMAGDTINDPFESTNRAIFSFNAGVDDVIIHPIVKGYNAALPEGVRTGVDNALKNLKSPTTFANQLLQGDLKGAGDVFVRTVVNTILGLGGIFDIAGSEGIIYEPEDFGQTLGSWGVGHGPYVVVPILGPSSMRDYAGYFVDSFADPLRWYLFNIDEEGIYYGKVGVEYLNLRASLVDVLEDLEKSSIDYYAATRSAYFQRRESMLNDQDPNAVTAPAIPDYDDY